MASDTMQLLVSETRRSRFSAIPNLSDEDIIGVWNAVASLIQSNMMQEKGVNIPTFGTFTLTKRKLDVAQNKYILIQRPVFVLSEKFATLHGIQTPKYHLSGHIPVVQLNYAALSKETRFDRDTVEGCVKELLQSFSRLVQGGNTLEFIFSGIGKLLIGNAKVKMKFFRNFLESMDGSGNLVKALSNRPLTADSIATACPTPDIRPLTGNSISVLPRISPGQELIDIDNYEGREKLQVILEEEPDQENKEQPKRSVTPDMRRHSEGPRSQVLSFEGPEDKLEVTSAPPRLQHPNGSTEQRKLTLRSPRSLGDVSKIAEAADKGQADGSGLQPLTKTSKRITIKNGSSSHLPHTATGVRDGNVNRSENISSPPKTAHSRSKLFAKGCSSCLHSAGQELCYLCYQREKRNFAVDTREQRRQKEIEEDRVLQKYQQLKDADMTKREQELRENSRIESSKVAAFNLGVSEAIKAKKNERPTTFHRSFVLQRRPVTPPFYLKQEEYLDNLSKQINEKLKTEKKENRERDLMERIEQVRLAEDLAAQREHYLRNKRLQSEEYRRALDSQIFIQNLIDSRKKNNEGNSASLTTEEINNCAIQKPENSQKIEDSTVVNVKEPGMIRYRPASIPATQPDSDVPIFGVNDVTEEKLENRRQRAKKLYEDQLKMAAEKQRQKMLKDLDSQKEEMNMLTRTKNDLEKELSERGAKAWQQQKDLGDSWANAAKLKHLRDSQELLRNQVHGGLVHEQCDKYRRCKLCQRHLGNCGETNVWSETRFLPGTRLIL